MNAHPVQIDSVETPTSRFDTAIEVLMAVLLIFMPLAFGAVEAWSEMLVVILAAAMTICLAAKWVFRRGSGFVWTWAYVPAALFLLVGAFQLIPLPTSVVGAVSPHTAATKTSLLGDLPGAENVLRSMTLSFYPCATRHDLRILLAVGAVFFVTVNVYRRPDQIKRLLAAIAVVGAAVALLALAQIVSGTDKLYWTVPTPYGKATSGSFLNYSHYSQFMNLSMGAAMALLLVRVHESFRGARVTLPRVMEYVAGREARIEWLLVGIIVVGAATVFLSLSRVGALTLLIAGSFTVLALASRRTFGAWGWVMGVVALAAFVCVLYVGLDAVYDRLATLRDAQERYQDRWQIIKDIAVGWTKFPVLGTGLGTHEVVYPMFDRSTIPALAAHAENEYAQAGEETGLVGLIGLLGFVAIVGYHYVRLALRRSNLSIRSAGFGLGFGLLAVLLHSLTDFGQHLPANACLSAISCGLLITLARTGRSAEAQPTPAPARRIPRVAGFVALAGMLALWVWSLAGAGAAQAAEAHFDKALRLEDRISDEDWLGTNEQFAELIGHAAAACESQPDNHKYAYWTNVYRWRAISRVADPQTGRLVMTPETLQFTRRIVDELHQVRILCPTFGPTYCVAGQLEAFVLDEPAGGDHIRTGFSLAPHDPTAGFVAGLLDVRQGNVQDSLEKFRRTLKLDGSFFREIADVYIHQARRPDLALAVAGDDVMRLFTVARALGDVGDQQELAANVRAEATVILKHKCQQPDAPAWALAAMGNLCSRDKNYAAAVGYYERALALDYGQVHWRLDLARALAKTGRTAQAIHQARVCLRLRPQLTAARELIADLSTQPDAEGDT